MFYFHQEYDSHTSIFEMCLCFIPFENDAIFEESFFMRSAIYIVLNNITIEIQETFKDHH